MTTLLRWTDTAGLTHEGPRDDVMRAAYLAGCHHTITTIEDSTMTMTCMNTECGNVSLFGFHEAIGCHYCRDCGTLAGMPVVASAGLPPIRPQGEGVRAAQAAATTQDDTVSPPFEGTWTKWDGEWCARIPVDDGENVEPGSAMQLKRKSGAATMCVAGETLRRFRNNDASGQYPYVAIVAVASQEG